MTDEKRGSRYRKQLGRKRAYYARRVTAKKYYRTLVSLSYYPRESKSGKTYRRVCQYYVFVISDEKDRYSVRDLEKVENHLSLLMSIGAKRSDIRWKNSVYEVPESSPISQLGNESNVPIDSDEKGRYKLNRVYRSAIFFKDVPVEYGDADISRIERRLNDSGDLKTAMDYDSGKVVRLWR